MKKTILFVSLPLIVILAIVLVVGVKKGAIFGRPNSCPTLLPPVESATVNSVLYPGQLRSGDYKAHGGFRVDSPTNAAEVKIPLDAKLIAAGRYIEQGEVQHILDFSASCGLDYRFDHLLTLSPKFQAIMDGQPTAVVSSSNVYGVRPSVKVTAGEIIATEVGFRQGVNGTQGPNVSFDFGVYDRGVKNAVSKDPAWAAKNGKRYQATHGLCWLDLLPPADTPLLKSLPGGDYVSGKQSDFCQP